MQLLSKFLLILSVVLLFAVPTLAKKRAGQAPMVLSGLDGRFYARCIPTAEGGGKGKTTIFRVEDPKDIVVDSYDFYPQHGMWLGWSPKAGKVAVMTRLVEQNPDPKKQVELDFYLGGKKLASWTTDQIWNMGATKKLDMIGGNCADVEVMGCEQIPGTNDYDFVLRTQKKTFIRFDILTGQPHKCGLPNK